MNKLAGVQVGGSSPTRIMGIINTSPESFYKRSVLTGSKAISKAAKMMEEDGADFIDVGGMSTAPYLKTLVSEEQETKRVTNAIKAILRVTKLPVSVDTCRAGVAKAALKEGAEIVNDVSGLKYDRNMTGVLEESCPSVILCAFSSSTVTGDQVVQAKRLIGQSVALASRSGIPKSKIVVDPAIGFFRKKAQGMLFTKIDSDWLRRDVSMLKNLDKIKGTYPILVSVSRKSFLGELLDEPDPENRFYGSLAAETFAALNGADIIRTHNVRATCDVVRIAQNLKNLKKGL